MTNTEVWRPKPDEACETCGRPLADETDVLSVMKEKAILEAEIDRLAADLATVEDYYAGLAERVRWLLPLAEAAKAYAAARYTSGAGAAGDALCLAVDAYKVYGGGA